MGVGRVGGAGVGGYRRSVIVPPGRASITGITWDFDSRVTDAPGSDLWQVTLNDAGKLFLAWGDGGGFNGTNETCRVGMGIASLVGTPTSYTTEDILGDPGVGCATNDGTAGIWTGNAGGGWAKPSGILAHPNGNLYLFRRPHTNFTDSVTILRSTDGGSTWTEGATWSNLSESGADIVGLPDFMQAGPLYGHAFDGYIYAIYFGTTATIQQYDDTIRWMRCPAAADPMVKANWTHWDGSGWTANSADGAGAYTEASGVAAGPAARYFPRYDRIVTMHQHVAGGRINQSQFVFQQLRRPGDTQVEIERYDNVSSPWGPASPTNFNQCFELRFVPGWGDGPGFVAVFSGLNAFDSYNTIVGAFTEAA